jgi:hypothetical protein
MKLLAEGNILGRNKGTRDFEAQMNVRKLEMLRNTRLIPIIKGRMKVIDGKAGFVAIGRKNPLIYYILQTFSSDELFQ